MDKFSLTEVSFVDRPAQKAALAEIQKNSDDLLIDRLAENIRTQKSLPATKQEIPKMQKQITDMPAVQAGETKSAYIARVLRNARAQMPDMHQDEIDGLQLRAEGAYGRALVAARAGMTKQQADDELERLARESVSKSGGTFYDAYVRVAHANPDLFHLAMTGEAREVQKMAAPESVDVAKRDDAHERLDKLARDEMAKQDVDYYEAYSLVSKRHPALYAQAVR